MKIEIRVSDDRRSMTVSVDGGSPVPLDHFLLLTKEGETARQLVHGSAEELRRLLLGLYVNSWRFEEAGMRGVLEQVAEEILRTRTWETGGQRAAERRFM